eukprot:scaffold266862_cov35-Tisochrysis_lutea.AAC.1
MAACAVSEYDKVLLTITTVRPTQIHNRYCLSRIGASVGPRAQLIVPVPALPTRTYYGGMYRILMYT